MMPWWHLAFSLIISYALVASLGLDVEAGIKWIIVGCLFGTLIDLDHIPYAYIIYREKTVEVVKRSILDPRGLIREFEAGGSLTLHASRRLLFHSLEMFIIYTICLYLFPAYSLVIGLAFIGHLLLDASPRWLKY
jgi:hypothetical protein